MPTKKPGRAAPRGKSNPKKAKPQVSSPVRLALEQSRRWAEDYIRIQQRQPESYLNYTRRGFVSITPEQLTDMLQWVHYCGRGNPT